MFNINKEEVLNILENIDSFNFYNQVEVFDRLSPLVEDKNIVYIGNYFKATIFDKTIIIVNNKAFIITSKDIYKNTYNVEEITEAEEKGSYYFFNEAPIEMDEVNDQMFYNILITLEEEPEEEELVGEEYFKTLLDFEYFIERLEAEELLNIGKFKEENNGFININNILDDLTDLYFEGGICTSFYNNNIIDEEGIYNYIFGYIEDQAPAREVIDYNSNEETRTAVNIIEDIADERFIIELIYNDFEIIFTYETYNYNKALELGSIWTDVDNHINIEYLKNQGRYILELSFIGGDFTDVFNTEEEAQAKLVYYFINHITNK